MSDKVELITACVGRSSFLKETLPLNISKVSNVIVVTTPTDFETQKICRDYGATCIETDIFYEYGAQFDKGKALNKGIDALQHKDWVIMTDCDVILTPPYKTIFSDIDLNKESFYGTRRVILKTRKEYIDFIKKIAFNPWDANLEKAANDDPKEVGVGFFQLFHMKSELIKEIKDIEVYVDDNTFQKLIVPIVKDQNYPRVLKQKGVLYPYFPTAGGSDSQFRYFFGEKKALAGISYPVIHLGSIGSGHGGVGRNFE